MGILPRIKVLRVVHQPLRPPFLLPQWCLEICLPRVKSRRVSSSKKLVLYIKRFVLSIFSSFRYNW